MRYCFVHCALWVISVSQSIPQAAPLDKYGHRCGSPYTMPYHILHTIFMYTCRLYSHKLSSNKSIWPTLLVLRRHSHLMMARLTLSTIWQLKQSMASQMRYIHSYICSSCIALNDFILVWDGTPLCVCVCVQVYKERVLMVAMNCAQQAAKTGVKRFIHVSTAQVYNSDKVTYEIVL